MKLFVSSIILLLFWNTDSVESKGKYTFEITITTESMGSINHIWLFTNKVIVVKENTNFRREDIRVIENKLLKAKEKNILVSFLKRFPLKKLKRSYINGGVKDGWQVNFNIKIMNKSKKIHTSNYYQKDLGRLVRELNKLVTKKITYTDD